MQKSLCSKYPYLSPTMSPMNTKLNDLEYHGQGYFPLMTLENN